MRLLPVREVDPACFYASGAKLKPDFAIVELNRILDFATEVSSEVGLICRYSVPIPFNNFLQTSIFLLSIYNFALSFIYFYSFYLD